MTYEFDAHTTVRPVSEGEYDAVLDAGWSVGGGINGGYLLATIGRALRASLPAKPDPLVVSAYYLTASRPGPARISVDVRRESRSAATASAELTQPGGDGPAAGEGAAGESVARIAALATYGHLGELPGEVLTTAEEIRLPPVEECVPSSIAPPELVDMAPLMGRFDIRFHPDQIGWVVGKPSGEGEMSAWMRLADGREPDPLALLMFVDALPPVTFNLGMPGWAPTIELTAHVRAAPAPGWLKVRHHTRNMAGGMFEEDCEIWDSTGRLVAQSRQLARQPRPA